MSTEAVVVRTESYNGAEDFKIIAQAADELAHATEERFEEIKKEKWFHRLFDMVTLSKKGEKRTAEQVASLAQAQNLLFRVLVKLSETDEQAGKLLRENTENIKILAEHDVALAKTLNAVETAIQAMKYRACGIHPGEDIAQLPEAEKYILIGSLVWLSKLYGERTEDQEAYARAVRSYVGVDASVDDLEQALESCNEKTRKMILTCSMEYIYLYDQGMTWTEPIKEYIGMFDLGEKTLLKVKKGIEDSVRLLGKEGLIEKYDIYDIMDDDLPALEEFEMDFTDEIPESEPVTEQEPELEPAEYEEVFLHSDIEHIRPEEERVYRNKNIYIREKINCEGTLRFEKCILHYAEPQEGGSITLAKGASFVAESSMIECHGYEEAPFIEAEEADTPIYFSDCRFVNCAWLLSAVSVEMNQCAMENPGTGFISKGRSLTMKDCAILRKEMPGFSPKEDRWKSVMKCDRIDLKNCEIRGNLSLSSAEEAAKEKDYERREAATATATLLQTGTGHIEKCTFHGIQNIFMDMQKLKIEDSVFEQCACCFNDTQMELTDCRFDQCTKIADDLSEGSVIENSQFNDCYGGLIKTDWRGNVSVCFCGFNNWQDCMDEDMLIFVTDKDDGHASMVSDCTFRGAKADTHHVIAGSASEKISGYAVKIESCDFRNCQTNRQDRALIKMSSSYSTVTDNLKFNAWINLPTFLAVHVTPPSDSRTQTLVSVKGCKGLEDVSAKSDPVHVDKKIMSKATGALIGASLANGVIAAGGPILAGGALAAVVYKHLAGDK